MSYLKYHRTKSDGWRENARCLSFKHDYRRIMQRFTHCTLPAYCTCNICLRQPPSLLASASHVVLNHVFSLEQSELTPDTTYDQYVYAFESKRVDFQKLLPPNFPFVRVVFRFDSQNQEERLHFHCPGRGSWHVECSNMFESSADAFKGFVKERNFFWCSFCDKPLLFPSTCGEHML